MAGDTHLDADDWRDYNRSKRDRRASNRAHGKTSIEKVAADVGAALELKTDGMSDVEEWVSDDTCWVNDGRPLQRDGRRAIADAIMAYDADLYGQRVRSCDDGGGWAIWLHQDDTTSYLHSDMQVEWYGSQGMDGPSIEVSGV